MIHKTIGALITGLFGSLGAAVFAEAVGEPGVALAFELVALGITAVLTLSIAWPAIRRLAPTAEGE